MVIPFREEFKVPDDFEPPEFLVAYYKVKVANHLDMHISDFTKHFVTTEEEKWIDFIKEHKTALQFIEKEQDRQFYLPKAFVTIVTKDAGLTSALNEFQVVLSD